MASAKYEIEFEVPDAPEIDPDGGTFGAQTDITITVPENCKVYYTWIRQIRVLHQQSIQLQYLFLREIMCFLLLR